MKKILLIPFLMVLAYADNNETKKVDQNSTKIIKQKETNSSQDQNKTTLKKEILQKELEKQIKREEIYAKEQKFYMGDEYNLKDKEVNEESLKHIPKIEPDYDFDITDVYADEQ